MKLTDEDLPTKNVFGPTISGKGFEISETNYFSAHWSDLDFVIFVSEANLFFYSVVSITLGNQDHYLHDIMEKYMVLKDAT